MASEEVIKTLNILILTSDLYPYFNANSEIVYRIAKELKQKHNCEISILGYNQVASSSFPDTAFGFHTIRMKSVTEYHRISLTTSSKVLKRLKLLMHPKSLRYYLRLRSGDKFNLVKEYQSQILKALQHKKFDCIVGFMEPKETLLAISNLKLQIPYIAYKLDPWSTNFQYVGNIEERHMEEIADAGASRIIVTDLIKKDYEDYASPDTLCKLETAEFPNIIKYNDRTKSAIFEEGKIHCVFAGGLYKDIRDPKYTIGLFQHFNDDRLVFHIFGCQYGGQVLPDSLPSNIIYHGQVSSDEAMTYMQSADILVNIGNTVSNQMPSKILTYISLGKPILNIVKNPQCPTLRYTEKYPLALNIVETPEVQQEDVERVRGFISTTHKKSIPFEKIKELYDTCTPEYVGNRLYNIICEVIKEKEYDGTAEV